MKANLTFVFALAILSAAGGIAAKAAAPPLAPTGAAKFAAYTVCHSLAMVDLGALGSNSSAECTGIVKNREDAKTLDNRSLRCLEESRARKDGYSFTGTCTETDADGDKIYLTYEGPESGPLEWIGGTGKFKDVTGHGTWSVTDAPGNNASLFAFTLEYSMSWRKNEAAK